jgi:hypothetical protein
MTATAFTMYTGASRKSSRRRDLRKSGEKDRGFQTQQIFSLEQHENVQTVDMSTPVNDGCGGKRARVTRADSTASA